MGNFEIRVGQDAVNIGNNPICYQQLDAMGNGVTSNFTCLRALYGSWVSVNKSDNEIGKEHLELHEVRVFGVHGRELIL